MLGSHVLPGNQVRFRFHHNTTASVGVAGNFSGWQPVPLSRQDGGWWGLDIGPMPAGNLYYKFVTPMGWHTDPHNLRRTHDGQNSLLSVGGGCGHLLQRKFHTPALGVDKEYVAYFPPEYATDPDLRLPYLILMGGLFEGASGWIDQSSIHERLDRLIVSKTIDPMIVVMPDKDDAVFKPKAWDAYFAFLSRDLPGHLEAEYRTSGIRAAEGLSLGGVWALRLAALHPERFCSAASLSGQIDGKVCQLFERNSGRMLECSTRVRLACGDGEGEVVANNAEFAAFVSALGLTCEFRVNHGIHRWPLWQSQIEDSLKFHDYSFKKAR